MSISEDVEAEWPSAEEKAKHIAQAKALRTQAEKRGLRFSAYLPPGLADWLLGLSHQRVPAVIRTVATGDTGNLPSHGRTVRIPRLFSSATPTPAATAFVLPRRAGIEQRSSPRRA